MVCLVQSCYEGLCLVLLSFFFFLFFIYCSRLKLLVSLLFSFSEGNRSSGSGKEGKWWELGGLDGGMHCDVFYERKIRTMQTKWMFYLTLLC